MYYLLQSDSSWIISPVAIDKKWRYHEVPPQEYEDWVQSRMEYIDWLNKSKKC